MYCYLCEEYIGVITTQKYCDVCRSTKNIQRIYGKEECLKILKNVCLRDEDKRKNKIEAAKGCYSPANKMITRSQQKTD